MKKIMLKTMLVFIGICASIVAHSQSIDQQVIGSSGAYFDAGNSKLQWTAGEMVIETFTGGSVMLTQGFHQTNLTITSIDHVDDNFGFDVFPNPTSDFVTVNCGDPTLEFILNLFDVAGQLVATKRGIIGSAAIDLSTYERGNYFLTIEAANVNAVKSFRIIKM